MVYQFIWDRISNSSTCANHKIVRLIFPLQIGSVQPIGSANLLKIWAIENLREHHFEDLIPLLEADLVHHNTFRSRLWWPLYVQTFAQKGHIIFEH